MWQMAIPAAINLAGGLLGRSSAKKAADQQAQAREAQAATYDQWGNTINQGYQNYGDQMFGLADTALEKYKFNPIAARNAFGSVGMQGNELVTQMSPELQAMYGMGANWMQQAGMFDRAGAQGAYFQNLMGMAAPARALQTQGLLRQLQAKGMAELGSNVNGNMLMKGMSEGWANQDLAASKMAMDYGGNELDRMLARGTGMFTNAANLSNNTFNQWQAGQGAANPFQMGGIGAYLGLMQKGYASPLEGMLAQAGYATNAAGIRAGAQVNQAAANDAANQGLIRGAVGALNQVPWGGMFGSFGFNGAKNNLFQSAYGPTSMN